MKHATKCKFCQKQIVLTIDDAYSELGDPLKLLGFASCNLCADLRVKLRTAKESIIKTCQTLLSLVQLDNENRIVRTTRYEELCAKYRKALEITTRVYAKTLAEILGNQTYLWDNAFVDMLLEKPMLAWKILRKYDEDCKRNPTI